ncbi:GMC family oxidoreductase [Pelagibius sp.]|uniref:GMC family oxidoreductase n=1 Tax=Pelagibius sp. TaxID=1931238 RepID=UPI003B50C7FF
MKPGNHSERQQAKADARAEGALLAHDPAAYDYIIVGAGSAGCVLANRLSADPDKRVLLLEAGGRDWNPWIHVPVGYFKTMHNPNTDWCYRTEADEGLNGRSLDWPRGKVLGGSSSINGLLYVRGQKEDYDHWRQLGNAGWSYDDVLPYFKRSEDQERGADDYHGAGGPLAVSNMRIRRELCDRFIEAAVELGIPASDDFNGAEQEGAGYFQLTARNGRRCSTAVGYLHPVRHRANLEVVTHAQVERLVFDGRRAAAVAYRRKGEAFQASCRGEIVLAAGAIGSPQILMLSGIGPGGHLQDFSIPLVHDLPGVGGNLQDHLQVRMVFQTKRPITMNDQVRNPAKKALMGLEYLLKRSGPLTMGASQVCVFARSSEEAATPDIQFHLQPLSADKPGEGLHKFSAFTSSTCQLRPESKGRIALRSPDAAEHPAIHPNYLNTAKDQAVTVAGMKMSRRFAATKVLAPLIEKELLPGPEVVSDEDLLEAARNISQTIYHPVGTCKMGRDPGAVVDERLAVHGLQGLRVVDASIMPAIVSGNTNAPTIMIAEKASDMILADSRG